jgi:UDP-N-acetylmuramoyl-L-alanyl-D-glutamate--2,6-diaminopimelate ligase
MVWIMKLTDVLQGVEVRKIVGTSQREVMGIACHTQRVDKGFLFAALRGLEADGHRFIGEAVKRGAEAVILEDEGTSPGNGTMIFVPNSRQALAKASSNFYGNPSSHVKLIGVTGTNGKTTTTYLLESIFEKAGYRVGVIGTINYRFGGKVIPAPNTTPESLDLQKMLWEMVREGVSHVIMEVSSHGLDLDRVFACQFDGGIFTNFTQDHLDYHGTLDRYFASKKKLFSDVLMKSPKPHRFAVTNHDDSRGEEIVDGITVPVIRYGLASSCQVFADQVTFTFEGLSCRISTPRGEFWLHSKLIGMFNLYNILAAVAAAIAMNLPLNMIKGGIDALEGVSGRFERVDNQKEIHVIVDYAHTPDALERVLLGISRVLEGRASRETPSPRPQETGKIITVFGCGGDRDRTKRPLMAEVVGRYSDLAVLTSDNPRTEDPQAIMAEVEKGFKTIALKEWDPENSGAWRSGKGYLKIPDRREAIRRAVRMAQPSDTVLIAGKGHEDYQIIGKKKFPFDDRVEAKRALEES